MVDILVRVPEQDAVLHPLIAPRRFGAQSQVLYCILAILEIAKGFNSGAGKCPRGRSCLPKV